MTSIGSGVRTIDLKRFWTWTALERAALTVGLAVFFIIGYFGIGLSTDPARARELATPVDKEIPFLACSVWAYLWIFPAALIPLFVVRCPRLLRRTALAYAVAIALSLVCFAVFPVTSERLRVHLAMLEIARPSDWAVSVLYSIDPPFNLFPSLHLSLAALSAFSAWKAARSYGVAAFVGVGFVGVSACMVKQHFLLDILGGLVLAALTGALILQPYRSGQGVKLRHSWRGLVAYFVLLILAYAGFYAAFLVGVAIPPNQRMRQPSAPAATAAAG
jgi:membrane-associated phospholipid phosphatase